MKTRIIHTKFWQDNYIATLNPTEKLLFIYLLTNEKANLCGIYELPDKFIMFDLDIDQGKLDEIKSKFSRDNKFYFFEGYIKIVNSDKYNNYSGEKNETAKNKELSMISDTVSKYFDTLSIEYRYPIDTSINHKSEIINNKQEEKKEKINKKEKKEKSYLVRYDTETGEPIYETWSRIQERFLKLFNTLAEREFRKLDSKSVKQLQALLDEGLSLRDVAYVVDEAKNDLPLRGIGEKAYTQGKDYLTPEYITRPDKFDKYYAIWKEKQAGNRVPTSEI